MIKEYTMQFLKRPRIVDPTSRRKQNKVIKKKAGQDGRRAQVRKILDEKNAMPLKLPPGR